MMKISTEETVLQSSMSHDIVKKDFILSSVSFMLTFGDHGFGSLGLGQYLGPACWPWFDLLWVYDGSVTLQTMGNRELTLIGGSGALIYPQTDFVGRSLTANCRVSVQHFDVGRDTEVFLRPLERLRSQKCGIEVYQTQASDHIEQDIKRAVNLNSQPPTPAMDAARVAITILILAQLEERIVSEPIFRPRRIVFDRLREWLTQQLDRDVSLEEMASYVALSPSYFRTEFRSHFGISPGKFFHNMRIAEAARLLRETNRPIKRIVADIGQQDLSNFYRAFRRCTSLTPANYRLKHTPTG